MSLVVAVAALVLALPSALGRPAQFSYRSYLERLPGTTLAYTLENRGSNPIRLVALRGEDFTITGANVLSAGGGSAVCGVSGNPPTLTCRNFELRKGGRLVALLATTRPATRAEQAITDGSEPPEISFFPLEVSRAQPRGTVRYQRVGKTRLQIIGRNTGFVRFTQVIYSQSAPVRRVLSFRVIRPRALTTSAVPPCKVRRVRPKPPSKPFSEVACHAIVDAQDVFFEVLLTRGAFGSTYVKSADGKVTQLTRN